MGYQGRFLIGEVILKETRGSNRIMHYKADG